MLIYAPSHFVADTEGSTLDSTELSQMLTQSCTWKTKFLPPASWSKILKKADWMTRLFGPISRRLTLARGGAELMQSWAATLASRSPLRESGKEQKTRGTCGHTLQESLTLFGQEYASLKTCAGTFDWDCQKCLGNSEALVTELGREYSQRRKSALRTDERECSFLQKWPTPRAAKEEAEEAGKRRNNPMLSTVVTQQLWPTACARDWKDTPGQALEGTNPDGSHRSRTDKLPMAVELWRTPSASDGEGGAYDMEKARAHGMKPKLKLRDHVLDGRRDLAKINTNGKSPEQLTASLIPPGLHN